MGDFGEPFVFVECLGDGGIVRNRSGVSEQLAVAEAQKIVKLRDPVLHGHLLSVASLEFSEVQVGWLPVPAPPQVVRPMLG